MIHKMRGKIQMGIICFYEHSIIIIAALKSIITSN
ncbi:hypothetical protein BDD43_4729 [Mucilaginibacter gracilis]|uniref:Uncharacterized protein n=1 Tax=Mucilaginibacter gracilis TaxID=423350 RepID=A0A495J664_9SPHI|nr:hypothetical protein BDD43_4729 [Mucilaginibacter gracilis]